MDLLHPIGFWGAKTYKVYSTFLNFGILHQFQYNFGILEGLFQVFWYPTTPPPPPADPVQSSRNCLKYSEKCIPSIQGNFLPSLAFILFTCKKNGFQLETGFHPGFKFSTSHFVDGRSRVLQVFSLNRLIANKRASISRAILEIGAKAVIYI